MVKHLDRKYFRYRADIVARWQEQYPDRASVLALSEVMRLGFLWAGSALVAVLCTVLAVTAAGRVGWTEWRPWTFAACAAFAAYIVARTGWALTVERRKAIS